MKHLLETNKYFDYIGSDNINGVYVEYYVDDYGQSVHIAWEDQDGIHEESCGTYNLEYEEYARLKFDEDYAKQYKKQFWYCSGREYALRSKQCPDKTGYAPMCIDCPDGCPLEWPTDPKNDPNRHPEQFEFNEN